MTQDIISKLHKSKVQTPEGTKYQSELVDLVRSIQESLPAGVHLSRWQTNKGKFNTRITYAIHHGPRADRSDRQAGAIASTVLYNHEGKTAQCEAYQALTAIYDRYLLLKQYI